MPFFGSRAAGARQARVGGHGGAGCGGFPRGPTRLLGVQKRGAGERPREQVTSQEGCPGLDAGRGLERRPARPWGRWGCVRIEPRGSASRGQGDRGTPGAERALRGPRGVGPGLVRPRAGLRRRPLPVQDGAELGGRPGGGGRGGAPRRGPESGPRDRRLADGGGEGQGGAGGHRARRRRESGAPRLRPTPGPHSSRRLVRTPGSGA
mmetsp:Transcript_21322/g.48093  ORF Transcript_21322/g.48093 Transcript_21322/m.48093 type:complete len:207 (+) Transcript_21322:889-1509(+)